MTLKKVRLVILAMVELTTQLLQLDGIKLFKCTWMNKLNIDGRRAIQNKREKTHKMFFVVKSTVIGKTLFVEILLDI